MTTVKERLISLADTDVERDLIALWMNEDSQRHPSRARAWEEIDARMGRGTLRFSW